MKKINWDSDKNKELQMGRNISFEVITSHIEKGNIIDIMEHPNKEKYSHQKIFVIEINEYIYLVPFVENNTEVFLKTIIPSRKATKKYLKD